MFTTSSPVDPAPSLAAAPLANPAPLTPPVAPNAAFPAVSAPVTGNIMPVELRPALPPPKLKRWVIPGLIAVVVLVAVGALAYVILAVMPQNALGSYIKKLASAKTAAFTSSAGFSTNDPTYSSYNVNVTFNGKYDISDLKAPKADVKVEGKISDTGVSGELILAEKALFFKIGSLDLLGSLGIQLSKDWYKVPLDQSTLPNADCTNLATSKSSTILGNRILNSLPLKNTKRIGIFQTINGVSTTHYQGQLDTSRIGSYISSVNNQLPADCKLDYTADDFKNLSLTYDLWTSPKFDRLNLVGDDSKSHSHVTVSLDTTDYNKKVTITAPANSQSLGDLFNSSSDALSSGDVASTPDTQRKTDMRDVKTALETYFNDNNAYPSGVGTAGYAGLGTYLVPDYLKTLPVDPKGGTLAVPIYQYDASPSGCTTDCTSYVLTATLDNLKDPQAGAGGIYTISSVN